MSEQGEALAVALFVGAITLWLVGFISSQKTLNEGPDDSIPLVKANG